MVYLLSAVDYSVYAQGYPGEITTVAYFSPESLKTLALLQGSKVYHLGNYLISGPLFSLDSGVLVLAISRDTSCSLGNWE